jgi:hypothetical protein
MKIKVNKADVIEKNRTFIESFTSGLRANDGLKLVIDRVGDKVDVSPNNKFAKNIQITFKPNLVVAVSDPDSDLKSLVSLINALAGGGAIGALGSEVTGLAPLAGIATASLETLEKILKSADSNKSIILQIPIETESQNSSGSESASDVTSILELKSGVVGFTVTTDTNGDNEKANIEFICDLNGEPGNLVVTKNEGRQRTITISSRTSDTAIEDPTGVVNGNFTSQLVLKTNGGIFIDTISLIRIDKIQLNLNVKASKKKFNIIPGGGSGGTNDKPKGSGIDGEDETPKEGGTQERNPEGKNRDNSSLRNIEGIGEEKQARFVEAGIKNLSDLANLKPNQEIEGFSKEELHDYLVPSARLFSFNLNEEEVEGLVKGFNVKNIGDLIQVAKNVETVSDLTTVFDKAKVRFPASFQASELLAKLKTIG